MPAHTTQHPDLSSPRSYAGKSCVGDEQRAHNQDQNEEGQTLVIDSVEDEKSDSLANPRLVKRQRWTPVVSRGKRDRLRCGRRACGHVHIEPGGVTDRDGDLSDLRELLGYAAVHAGDADANDTDRRGRVGRREVLLERR